ncbi:MAG TPA: hypothetical protein VD973_25720 [Symbiobacteriaceae bacterium]|nr:hypothetical protein [Symbiobacteriaceae bacterium]
MAKGLKSLLPKPSHIHGRRSSITYAIAASASPYAVPTEAEFNEMLQILGMDRDHLRCVFCNKPTKRLGHLNALVEDRQPTGWGTTIGNLVPVCSTCGSRRGNQPWAEWLQQQATDKTWPGHANVIETTKRLTLLEQRFPDQRLVWSQKIPPDLAQEFRDLQAEVIESLDRLHKIGTKIKAYFGAQS